MCRNEFIETTAILFLFIPPIKVHMLFRFMPQAGYIYFWKLFVLVNSLVASSISCSQHVEYFVSKNRDRIELDSLEFTKQSDKVQNI